MLVLNHDATQYNENQVSTINHINHEINQPNMDKIQTINWS